MEISLLSKDSLSSIMIIAIHNKLRNSWLYMSGSVLNNHSTKSHGKRSTHHYQLIFRGFQWKMSDEGKEMRTKLTTTVFGFKFKVSRFTSFLSWTGMTSCVLMMLASLTLLTLPTDVEHWFPYNLPPGTREPLDHLYVLFS